MNQKIQITILDQDTVAAFAPSVVEAADLIHEAFRVQAEGDVDQPLKPYVRPAGRSGERDHGRLITMPAWLGGRFRALGFKSVASFRRNAERYGLPRASAATVLFDPDTGVPEVVMEGAYLSALRTGGAALFALRELRAPGTDRVAVLGTGAIGRQVVKGLQTLEGLREIILFDAQAESARRLAAELRAESDLHVVVADDARSALAGAGAGVAATTADGPYLEPEWFAPGCVFVALSLVDAAPRAMIEFDHLVVDDWEQGCREGKPLEALWRAGAIAPEQAVTFAQLAAGRQVRRSPGDRIYVNPMGVAIEDLAVAAETWTRARAAGAGVKTSWL